MVIFCQVNWCEAIIDKSWMRQFCRQALFPLLSSRWFHRCHTLLHPCSCLWFSHSLYQYLAFSSWSKDYQPNCSAPPRIVVYRSLPVCNAPRLRLRLTHFQCPQALPAPQPHEGWSSTAQLHAGYPKNQKKNTQVQEQCAHSTKRVYVWASDYSKL